MFTTLLEPLDLAYHISFGVANAQKGTFNPSLEPWVFNPFAKISTPEANLLELFKFDIFDEFGYVLAHFIGAFGRVDTFLSITVISITIITAILVASLSPTITAISVILVVTTFILTTADLKDDTIALVIGFLHAAPLVVAGRLLAA